MEVLLCVGLVIGSTAGLRALFGVAARRRMYKLAANARRLLSSADFEIVPVTAADARAVARLERHPAQADLLALGFTLVGDRREVFRDPSLDAFSSVQRYFIAASGTTVASFSARGHSPAIQSWTESGVFTTTVANVGFFAVPPSHRYQHVPSSKGARELVAQHEKWLRLVAALTTDRAELTRVSTIEEIVELTKNAHLQMVKWRNSHGDDDLLRKDLEGLLGAGYENRGGAKLFSALVAKPPTARVRTPASKGKSRP